MNRRPFLKLALGASMLAWSSRGRATLYVATPSDALIARADVVTLARVESCGAEWWAGRILTRAVLACEETFKGAHAPALQLLVPGGTIDGIAMRVAGYPDVRAGDRAVLLLAQIHGAPHRLVGAAAGKLDVRIDGGVETIRVPSADGRTATRAPLAPFKESLRAAIERTRRAR